MASRAKSVDIEAARLRLPELVSAAERNGRSTLICLRGRPVAALVPLSAVQQRPDPGPAAARDLLALSGAGKGLWGSDPARHLRELREGWD